MLYLWLRFLVLGKIVAYVSLLSIISPCVPLDVWFILLSVFAFHCYISVWKMIWFQSPKLLSFGFMNLENMAKYVIRISSHSLLGRIDKRFCAKMCKMLWFIGCRIQLTRGRFSVMRSWSKYLTGKTKLGFWRSRNSCPRISWRLLDKISLTWKLLIWLLSKLLLFQWSCVNVVNIFELSLWLLKKKILNMVWLMLTCE